MGSSQGLLGFVLILILAAGFAVIIWLAYRQAKNRWKEIEAQGFQRWLVVDPRFAKSVCSLAAYPYPERLDVGQAFLRSLPDMQLVIYDLVVKFGAESGGQRSQFAVYSAEGNFPSMRIFPKPEEFDGSMQANSGRFTVNKLLQSALKRSKETRLEFSGQPEFDKRFSVTAKDEERARSILTPERLKRLTGLPKGVMLQISGGVILVDKPGFRVERRRFQQYISEMTDLAIQAAQAFLH